MQSIFFAKDKSGNEVSIFDVNSGLACNCTCIDCGKPLIAHQGSKKAWHFQHESYKGCTSAEETSLHKLAKLALSDMKEMVLPPVSYLIKGKSVHLEDCETFIIEETQMERSISGRITPDLIIMNSDDCVYIEFCVTHKSAVKKIKTYREMNCKAIEIRLKESIFEDCKSLTDLLQAIKKCLISVDYTYVWLSHPSMNNIIDLIEDKGVSFYNSSGLDKIICPNRSVVVNAKDCKFCPYNILFSKKEVKCRGNLTRSDFLKISPNTVFPPMKINYVGGCPSCYSQSTDLKNGDSGLLKVCNDCGAKIPQVCPICGGILKKMINNDSRFDSYRCEFLGCDTCSFTLTFRKPNGDFADEMVVTGGLFAISNNNKIYTEELRDYRKVRRR